MAKKTEKRPLILASLDESLYLTHEVDSKGKHRVKVWCEDRDLTLAIGDTEDVVEYMEQAVETMQAALRNFKSGKRQK